MKFVVRKRPTGVDESVEPQITMVQKIQSSIEDPLVQRRDNEVHILARGQFLQCVRRQSRWRPRGKDRRDPKNPVDG